MTNSKYITRLKRSEGQLRGIQKMIEEDRDCADIVTQLTAVKSSVERVIEMIITENLTECINQPLDFTAVNCVTISAQSRSSSIIF